MTTLGFEPKEINPHTWIVPSQSGCGTYTVTRYLERRHWKCTCPDYLKRGVNCKHICAVKIWKNLRDKFEQMNLPDGDHFGLIAQDVEKVAPEVVSTDHQGMKSIDYANLTVLLIEAIKEQQTTIECLVQKVTHLEAQLSKLSNK